LILRLVKGELAYFGKISEEPNHTLRIGKHPGGQVQNDATGIFPLEQCAMKPSME